MQKGETMKIMIEIGGTGERCHQCFYRGTKKMGTVFVCRLFPSDHDSHTCLEDDKDGYLLRCKACLGAEND
jgi:hypothetical protein